MSYNADRWVRRQTDLHKTPSAVLANLAGRCKSKSLECWPSQTTIAKDLRMSRRTVGLALGYLEEQGYIERERQHRRENGHRAQDRITLLMPTEQTVVQIWRGYDEFLIEMVPSRYAHRPEKPYVHKGPMRSAAHPYAFGERSYEQEEGTGRSTSTRSTSSDQRGMYVEVARENDDWAISVHNPGDHFSQDTFCRVFEGLVSIALDAGVGPDDISHALQDSWVEASWVESIDRFQDRLDSLRTQTNVRILRKA